MGNLLKRLEQPTPTPPLQFTPSIEPPAPASPPPAAPEPARAPAANDEGNEARVAENKLRRWLVEKILTHLPPGAELARDAQTIQAVRDRFAAALGQSGVTLSPADAERIQATVLSEILGYGPLEPLLADATITEIMVNGPSHVYIEYKGKVTE